MNVHGITTHTHVHPPHLFSKSSRFRFQDQRNFAITIISCKFSNGDDEFGSQCFIKFKTKGRNNFSTLLMMASHREPLQAYLYRQLQTI
ncbi:hypothetical protein AB3S75_041492 [Citrus x aurantiifolia]